MAIAIVSNHKTLLKVGSVRREKESSLVTKVEAVLQLLTRSLRFGTAEPDRLSFVIIAETPSGESAAKIFSNWLQRVTLCQSYRLPA
ncbi:hypothetical protein [Leptothermofonsia sp. ETS-13]|uniref:hypothetical protein n=1 Tax=Leptothermofonsia sp. ETS-13 TaxID=3035696 RepID=UPI003BA352D4